MSRPNCADRPGKGAEGHDVEDRHPPGVLVLKMSNCCLMLALIGTDLSIVHARIAPIMSGIQTKAAFWYHTVWSGLPGNFICWLPPKTERTDGDEVGREQLADDRDTEVADAGLQAERGALLGAGRSGRRGHEAGERAAADAGEEGQHHEPPVGERSGT